MFNRQKALNDAVDGLNEQRAFSMYHLGECLYRSPTGNKCAVGFLIPDDKYDPGMEDMSPEHPLFPLDALASYGEPNEDDRTFLTRMQEDLHDDLNRESDGEWDQSRFNEAVAKFASEYNLENPNVN